MSIMKQTTMYMTVGLPGCGKSTWAEQSGLPVFSSDAIRLKNPGMDNPGVFRILNDGIKKELFKGNDSIYDATNLSRKNRRAFIDEIKGIDCRKVCVFFLVPLNVCKERNAGRDQAAVVPDHVYDKMLRAFNLPSVTFDGFDEIVLKAYDGDFELPDYEDLDDFSQDNRYHNLTLGRHMKATADFAAFYAKDCDEDFVKLVTEAARWHDIGKFHTKDFHNSKGEPSEDAHYYGHENYSTYMYLLKWLNETPADKLEETRARAFEIAEIINWHMTPHNIWPKSKKRAENDKRRLDPEVYKAIKILYEADVKASETEFEP